MQIKTSVRHYYIRTRISSVQLHSRIQLFVTLWTAAPQASLSINVSWSVVKLMPVELVMPSNHLILCHPLLLLPSIFPSIRVFSNESVLCIRWPKYWSFSFSISPSNESPVLRVKAKHKIWSPLAELHPPPSTQPMVFTL